MSETLVTRHVSTLVEPPISWSSIVAGALVGLAVSVFLTLLAAGFGYDVGAAGLASRGSLAMFTPELGAGAIAIQVVSAGLGGFLTGRLRHGWASAHIDEAHFRDTAHGLLTWALASVAGLLLAVAVVTPYAEHLRMDLPAAPPDPARAAQVLAQSMFFAGVGMILSAFTAAVAARVGGLENERMLRKAYPAQT